MNASDVEHLARGLDVGGTLSRGPLPTKPPHSPATLSESRTGHLHPPVC